MTERIIGVLKSIGLNKNEVKIFMDLIKKDSSSALDISKRTEIHRSNVYDSLRILMEKGFVSERTEGKKKLFQALDPIRIKEYVVQKGREIDSIMPELQQYSARRVNRGNVSISQGVFAFRSVLMGLLEDEKPITIYGIPKGLREKLGEGFLEDFHSKRIEKGISIRNIYARDAFDDNVVALGEKDRVEVRYEQRQNQFNVATIICGDKVFIIVFGDIVSIIEIDAEEVAESYRSYFEILWGYSRAA
jgi:sugar-specific transcriptional regulator TrmB